MSSGEAFQKLQFSDKVREIEALREKDGKAKVVGKLFLGLGFLGMSASGLFARGALADDGNTAEDLFAAGATATTGLVFGVYGASALKNSRLGEVKEAREVAIPASPKTIQQLKTKAEQAADKVLSAFPYKSELKENMGNSNNSLTVKFNCPYGWDQKDSDWEIKAGLTESSSGNIEIDYGESIVITRRIQDETSQLAINGIVDTERLGNRAAYWNSLLVREGYDPPLPHYYLTSLYAEVALHEIDMLLSSDSFIFFNESQPHQEPSTEPIG